MNPALQEALRAGERHGSRYALQVPEIAASGRLGSRLGRRAGTSIDFQDYREYAPGDDPRFVDWGIYARTDRLSVKLYREEVTPHLDLLVDGSRSMSLEGTSKSAATASLAALLATAAQNAQCSRAVWVAGEGFRRLANDVHPPAAWDHFELNSTLTLDQAFEMLPPKLRRMGVRVLVSDLLWPGDPLQTVRRLRQGAAALFIVQLLAREDAEPPEHGSLRLVDSETGATQDVFVDAAVRERYLGSLSLLQQAWDNACQQCGARMATLIAGGAGTELDCAALESMQLLVPA